MLTCFLIFVRKRKTRCKTTDVVYVLQEEVQWCDDDMGSNSNWPDIPEPSDPTYKKERKLSPKRKKKVRAESDYFSLFLSAPSM
jgi:hypothetical protein